MRRGRIGGEEEEEKEEEEVKYVKGLGKKAPRIER